jgi:ubiquinone biosynthesis protein
MEYIEGTKITEIQRLTELGLNPKLIAQRGVDLELKQIFEYGFFHADPHPGNVLVLPDNVICFLDFGMMGTLTRRTRDLVTTMVLGAINRDYEKITRNILKMCETTGEVNIQRLELQVTELVDLYFHQSIENIDMSELFTSLVDFFPQNNLLIPADLFALGRALILLQGDGEIIDPEFNIALQVGPYFKKLVRKRFHPEQYARELAVSSEEMLRLAKDMPLEIRELMEKAREGNLKVKMEHQGLDAMSRKHEQISNRITMAIILGSITLGSSILVLAQIPPLWHDIPVIGLLGFLAATVLGFWLLISIFRGGRI